MAGPARAAESAWQRRAALSGAARLAAQEDAVITDIERRISRVTQLPELNGEGIQILHYVDGQKYEPHNDYFFDSVNQAPELGGQRVATVLMYLCAPRSPALFLLARQSAHLSSTVPIVALCACGCLPRQRPSGFLTLINPRARCRLKALVTHDAPRAPACPGGRCPHVAARCAPLGRFSCRNRGCRGVVLRSEGSGGAAALQGGDAARGRLRRRCRLRMLRPAGMRRPSGLSARGGAQDHAGGGRGDRVSGGAGRAARPRRAVVAMRAAGHGGKAAPRRCAALLQVRRAAQAMRPLSCSAVADSGQWTALWRQRLRACRKASLSLAEERVVWPHAALSRGLCAQN
jgi:hypothetical protein